MRDLAKPDGSAPGFLGFLRMDGLETDLLGRRGRPAGYVPESLGSSVAGLRMGLSLSRLARGLRYGTASAALLAAAGCDRSPTISVLGSFFPAWMLCLLIGIALTFVVHWAVVRSRLAGQLVPALLVYPSLAGIFTMTLWLIFYS